MNITPFDNPQPLHTSLIYKGKPCPICYNANNQACYVKVKAGFGVFELVQEASPYWKLRCVILRGDYDTLDTAERAARMAARRLFVMLRRGRATYWTILDAVRELGISYSTIAGRIEKEFRKPGSKGILKYKNGTAPQQFIFYSEQADYLFAPEKIKKVTWYQYAEHKFRIMAETQSNTYKFAVCVRLAAAHKDPKTGAWRNHGTSWRISGTWQNEPFHFQQYGKRRDLVVNEFHQWIAFNFPGAQIDNSILAASAYAA